MLSCLRKRCHNCFIYKTAYKNLRVHERVKNYGRPTLPKRLVSNNTKRQDNEHTTIRNFQFRTLNLLIKQADIDNYSL